MNDRSGSHQAEHLDRRVAIMALPMAPAVPRLATYAPTKVFVQTFAEALPIGLARLGPRVEGFRPNLNDKTPRYMPCIHRGVVEWDWHPATCNCYQSSRAQG
jgi:hypothetical protein